MKRLICCCAIFCWFGATKALADQNISIAIATNTTNIEKTSALFVAEQAIDLPEASENSIAVQITSTDSVDSSQTSISLPLYMGQIMLYENGQSTSIETSVNSGDWQQQQTFAQAMDKLVDYNKPVEMAFNDTSGAGLLSIQHKNIKESTTVLSFYVQAEITDTDADGILDINDTDKDGDGIADIDDAFPYDKLVSIDTDRDGLADEIDPDDDNDGIADADDPEPKNVDPASLPSGQIFAQQNALVSSEITIQVNQQTLHNQALPLSASGYGLTSKENIAGTFEVGQVGSGSDSLIVAVKDSQNLTTQISLPFDVDYLLEDLSLPAGIRVSDGTTDYQLTKQGNNDKHAEYIGEIYVSANASIQLVSTNFVNYGGFSLTTYAINDLDNDNIPAMVDSNWDNDNYLNEVDLFPFDVTEWADLDLDGIGDNSDPDIDGDGVNNEDDYYPYDVAKYKPDFTLDINGDGHVRLPSDGFIILRHMVGFPAVALATDADMVGASRTKEEMKALLDSAKLSGLLDINGDSETRLPSDGFIILRHMVGFPAVALATEADLVGATRSKEEMKAFLQSLQ